MTAEESDAIHPAPLPFFVLHKASTPKSGKKAANKGITRKRSNYSYENGETAVNGDGIHHSNLRFKLFSTVWLTVESTINNVLEETNIGVFDEIHQWVCKSYEQINSVESVSLSDVSLPFPVIADAVHKRIYTGFVLTKNIEFVDDHLTFKSLGEHLKSKGCHVANLSSQQISQKNGMGGCLRSILRQFLGINADSPDISILAAWYRKGENYNYPIVVIIEDLERCSGSILSAFIFLLREWALKIPVVLLIGVTTTLESVKCTLPSNAYQCLLPSVFELGTPFEKMDAICKAILINQHFSLALSHEVALFLRNYFVRHDGTLTSFIRGLKIAFVRHCYQEELTSLLPWLHLAQEYEESAVKEMLMEEFDFSSMEMDDALKNLKKSQIFWKVSVQCVYEVIKSDTTLLLDLICEAMDPNFSVSKEHPCHIKSLIYKSFQRIRALPEMQLRQLLQKWEIYTSEVAEVHSKVTHLLGLPTQHSNGVSKKRSSQGGQINDKAASILETLVRDYMRLSREKMVFKNSETIEQALIGDPRQMIQLDLMASQKILRCKCCTKSLSPSLPESSIMYLLSQEHGDVINIYSWFQAFKSVLREEKTKQTSRKRKKSIVASPSESSIQALFCRAVIELQIIGLVRMPTKRRPDYVQRLAFGISGLF